MNYFTLKYTTTRLHYTFVYSKFCVLNNDIEFGKDEYILAEFYNTNHILRKKLSLKLVRKIVDEGISVCAFRIRKGNVKDDLRFVDFGEDKEKLLEWVEKEIKRIENK